VSPLLPVACRRSASLASAQQCLEEKKAKEKENKGVSQASLKVHSG
jgi:hypothetical protein